ncbi:MAG TPA: nicotinamide-nucleotide amidohydrolase family protein, partial [Gallionellaceae bacterium]
MELLAAQVGEMLKNLGFTLATAESCTGGGVAQTVTEIPGSSEWFERGFVTYANSAKIEMLGV